MNKEKVWGIIKFYVSKNLQSKWFIIFNIFVFIVCLLTTNSKNILNLLEAYNINLFDEEIILEVWDKDNISAGKFETAFVADKNVDVRYVTNNEYTEENIGDEIVLVELEKDEKNIVVGKITSKETIANELYYSIADVFENIRADLFASSNNIDLKELEIMNTKVVLDEVTLAVNTDNTDEKMMINFVSSFIMYFLCILVFSSIAREIAEEKVSKSIEYVFTSVSAKEYLFAKIAGIIIVILLQMVYGLVYFFIGNFLNLIITSNLVAGSAETSLATMDFDMTLYVLIVFIYGLLTLVLMSIIQAAFSAKATSMADSNNTTLLLTSITIFAYMITSFVITPYTNMTPIIYVISCLPLLSNFFVPAIIVIGQATLLQITISLILLVVSIPIAFEICSKVFKNGVLDYSNKKIKESKKLRVERSIKEEQEYRFEISKYKNFSFALGLTIIAFVVLQVFISAIVPIFISPMLSSLLNDAQLELVNITLVSLGSFYFSFKIIELYTEKESVVKPSKASSKKKVGMFLKSFFLFSLLQIILPTIMTFIGVEYDMSTILDIDLDGTLLTSILYCLALAVVPAIFEELFFRKGIIDFSRKFGDKFAIICSAFFFGVIHCNVLQGIFAFLAGIVLGSLYLKTGSLKMPIILHFINNLVGCLGLIFEGNLIVEFAIVVFYYGTMILGALLLFVEGIIDFIKEYKEIKKMEKENIEMKKRDLIDFSKISKYKYIFCNYTFIVALILLAVLFIGSEKMVRLL